MRSSSVDFQEMLKIIDSQKNVIKDISNALLDHHNELIKLNFSPRIASNFSIQDINVVGG